MFISWIILSGENTFKRLNYNQKLKWLSITQRRVNVREYVPADEHLQDGQLVLQGDEHLRDGQLVLQGTLHRILESDNLYKLFCRSYSQFDGKEQLTVFSENTLIYRRIVLGSTSFSYTRTMLVFCNLANCSQYFLSKSDSSYT